MRPLYQLYHEVRAELDVLQGSIEKKYGLIPLFSDEVQIGEENNSKNYNNSSNNSINSSNNNNNNNNSNSNRKAPPDRTHPGSSTQQNQNPNNDSITPTSGQSPQSQGPQVQGPGQGAGSTPGQGSMSSADPFSSFLFRAGATPYPAAATGER